LGDKLAVLRDGFSTVPDAYRLLVFSTLAGMPPRGPSRDQLSHGGFMSTDPKGRSSVLQKWNADQVKHLVNMIDRVSMAQFLFLTGKRVYYEDLSSPADWIIFLVSLVLYGVAQIIIHRQLSWFKVKK
jgi:hypothetical protein